jgi:manganese-dependent ADP-ribose/CDP-alcohol diphosphatase
MKRWNGGTGEVQTNWFRSELSRAEAKGVRVIVASHHALAPGSCRETHRAWNGDELAAACAASPAFVLALAGHDHPGGFIVHRGRPFVTVEALLEAQDDRNAFAVLRVYEDRVVIDGMGTDITSRLISIPNKGEPLYCAYLGETQTERAALTVVNKV